MLQLLCDGLRDEKDYRIYHKRHVLELAMSFHISPLSDGASKVRHEDIKQVKQLGLVLSFRMQCLSW